MKGSVASIRGCTVCALVQEVPPHSDAEIARCARCGLRLGDAGELRRSSARSAAAAVAAFFLFWPAILLPVVRIEKLGHRSESSLLEGTIDLLRHGEVLVGSIVLVFSIILPLLKIALLIELGFLELFAGRNKMRLYRLVEHLGRWSMLDVLLLAFLVMLVKVGDLVTFRFGPAVIAFILCVFASLAASLWFDPRAIWGDPPPTPRSPRLPT